jgi:hypothetical protein
MNNIHYENILNFFLEKKLFVEFKFLSYFMEKSFIRLGWGDSMDLQKKMEIMIRYRKSG